MNKDKAIQLLERLQDPEPYEPMLTKDAYDAIQMAIDALSADGDTISRKAAIDRATKEHDFFRGAVTVSDKARRDELLNVMCWLGELPPAQLKPDQNGDLWITVPDIDEVTCIYVQESKSKFCRIFYEEQVERIKGRWLYSSYDDESGFDESWTCDQCGYMTNIEETNFCPNCGADMREVTT